MADYDRLTDDPDALEAPRDPITLAQAAQIAGLSVKTVRTHAERGHLKTARSGHRRFTTRRWLDAYLIRWRAKRNRPYRPA
jgi:MerR HTH family regulatory protein